jgi:hypothetical protein
MNMIKAAAAGEPAAFWDGATEKPMRLKLSEELVPQLPRRAPEEFH